MLRNRRIEGDQFLSHDLGSIGFERRLTHEDAGLGDEAHPHFGGRYVAVWRLLALAAESFLERVATIVKLRVRFAFVHFDFPV